MVVAAETASGWNWMDGWGYTEDGRDRDRKGYSPQPPLTSRA